MGHAETQTSPKHNEKTNFHVRPCQPQDLQTVLKIAEKYTSFDVTPTLADIEGLYSRNPEYFYVAEVDAKKIIGFITGYEKTGIPEQVLSKWNARRVGYVDLMAVEQQSRRQGVGEALIRKLLDDFRKYGLDTVNLDVPTTQTEAVKLYEKHGFNIRSHSMTKRLV